MIDEEEIEDRAYNNTLEYLKQFSLNNDFDIGKVKAELETMEKYEGLDWTGRGSIKSAEISGTIMAYQVFLMRYSRLK